MKMYSLDGNPADNPPSVVYRGLDLYKDKSPGIVQIRRLLECGSIPSKATLIEKKTFDFERSYKTIGPFTQNEFEE